MRLFDTHCHFERANAAEIRSLIERAKAAGVEKIMAVGQTAELNESAALAGSLGTLVATTDERACHAFGEIALEYHYSPETREEQLKLFLSQLETARARDLPVVIHTREADDDTLGALREVPSKGIIHCFTGSVAFAKKLLDLGFYISISGIVTFKKAQNVRDAALAVPNDRLLIETDSPYLAPVPMRGKVNESAFLYHTAKFLAALKGMDEELFAETTYNNAERCLNL